jgi:hypothetical protein
MYGVQMFDLNLSLSANVNIRYVLQHTHTPLDLCNKILVWVSFYPPLLLSFSSSTLSKLLLSATLHHHPFIAYLIRPYSLDGQHQEPQCQL